MVLLIAASAIALVLPQLSGARAASSERAPARSRGLTRRARRGDRAHREVSFVTAAEVSVAPTA